MDARPQLRFHADNRNLSGRYTCVAENGIGDPAEAHIDLRIRCEFILVRVYLSCYCSPHVHSIINCITVCFTQSFRGRPQLIEFNYDRPYRNDHANRALPFASPSSTIKKLLQIAPFSIPIKRMSESIMLIVPLLRVFCRR